MLYLIEGRPLKAAISFACVAPLVGNFVTGVKCAKGIQKASTAAKIMETCRAVQKLGNTADIVASSIEAAQKDTTCKTVGDRVKCAAGNMLKSFAMGAAISASAVVLKKAAKKALPVLSTTARKIAEKIGKRFGKSAGKGGRKTDFYVTPSGKVVPATGYRYMDSKYAEQTMSSMSAPGSYFEFEKFDSASAAQDAFQISPEWSDCRLRGEFDTLQVIDDMYVPKAYGDKGPGLEPFTRCYPEYGKEGAKQYIFKGTIKFKKVKLIGD